MSCLTCWMLVGVSSLGQSGPMTATKVAVVNVPVVSERYLKTAYLEGQFETKRLELAGQRDALRDNIDRTRRSLQEEFKPGSEEFGKRAKQLAMLEAEMQWLVETQGRRVEIELAASLRGIFADIQAAIGAVASERNIDVVLAADQVPPEPPLTTSQARQQIVLQKVLYWRPNVDLTDVVVSRLNADFEKARAAAPGGGIAKPPHVENE